MLKKTMLIAGVVAALTAVVLPAMANASARNWTTKGAGLPATHEVHATGTFAFTSEQGGIACPTTTVGTLHPGSTGTMSSFVASPTSGCTYSGALDVLCGTVTEHTVTRTNNGHISKQNPLIIHATKFPGGQYGFTITEFETHLRGTGAFCPNVTWHGEITATGDPHGSTFTLHGTLTSNITPVVHVSGHLQFTKAPNGENTFTIET